MTESQFLQLQEQLGKLKVVSNPGNEKFKEYRREYCKEYYRNKIRDKDVRPYNFHNFESDEQRDEYYKEYHRQKGLRYYYDKKKKKEANS